jgi:putative ATPase
MTENDQTTLGLFGGNASQGDSDPLDRPLAVRMRPTNLDEFVGQKDIVGPDTVLRRMIEQDRLVSLILWGPPGSGKTTLAAVIAGHVAARFVTLSAVTSGVKDVKRIVDQAAIEKQTGSNTILFIDEIHRYNKAQQDALLPHVERGTVTLIGATTENPSFDLNSALLSRSRVFVLKQLEVPDLQTILHRAVEDETLGLAAMGVAVDDDAIDVLSEMSDGDARIGLNGLEAAAHSVMSGARHITRDLAVEALQRTHYDYDKSGEGHYNLISALHKSVRSSDPQASLYWLARMIDAGEDPRYLARRMVRMAVEDIGLADPRALNIALDSYETYHMLGSPEGDLALAHCVIYLASAPKSNSVYAAFSAALADAREHGSLPVPEHLRNAPTRLMKDIGYGKGYQYDHDHPEHISGQECLPEKLHGKNYFEPSNFGYENTITDRMRRWDELRIERRQSGDT